MSHNKLKFLCDNTFVHKRKELIMHKDDKMPKETLGEKMKDKAGEIKEELKEDAEILKKKAHKAKENVKEKAHEMKEKVSEKMDEMKEKHKNA